MADASELIRYFSAASSPTDLFIRGGKIYIVRRGSNVLSVYDYSGDRVRDLFTVTEGFDAAMASGRVYLTRAASGATNIRIRHYDGSSIRDTTVGFPQKSIVLRGGKMWLPQDAGAKLHVCHYDGSDYRTVTSPSIHMCLGIRGGRLYGVDGVNGYLRIMSLGAEILVTREAEGGAAGVAVKGGRFFMIHYNTQQLRIVNYAYFNIP